MNLRYLLLSLALILSAPAALADPCRATNSNGTNEDDVIQGQGGQAILFGTSNAGTPQELGQSFTATCDGKLDFFRVIAINATSAEVTISGDAILFAGSGVSGQTLQTVPFTLTVPANTTQRALEVTFDEIAVTTGSLYTVFLDITSGTQTLELAAAPNNAYSGGQAVVSASGSTTNATTTDSFDLAFRARFKPGPVASEEVAQSATVSLQPTQPNPAIGRTRVPFTLRQPADVRLSVYDALGREVAVVAERAYGAGEHAETLDVSAFAPGTYVVRLVAGADVVLRTIAVAR